MCCREAWRSFVFVDIGAERTAPRSLGFRVLVLGFSIRDPLLPTGFSSVTPFETVLSITFSPVKRMGYMGIQGYTGFRV